MKNIFKSILFAFCVVALGSCEDDPDPIVSLNGFQLRTSDGSTDLILNAQNSADKATTLVWDRSDYGGFNTSSIYTIEASANGTNFAEILPINSGNTITNGKTAYDFTVNELNTIANKLPGYVCGQPMKIDVRVKSVLGNGFYNQVTQYSSVLTLDVSPYSNLLPTLAFSASATVTADTPKLASSGVLNKDFEGYMWLQPGTYKFYQPNACGGFESPIVYGDSGDGVFDTLEIDGDGYEITTAGFYLVKADLQTLKYSIRSIKWNFYGTAKQTFPASNVAMTYNATEKVWESNVANPVRLAEGYGLKFRSDAGSVLGAYNATGDNTSLFAGSTLTYLGLPLPIEGGPSNSPYVFEVSVPGPKVPVRVIKSYVVKLDLNSPRNYKFSITEVPAI